MDSQEERKEVIEHKDDLKKATFFRYRRVQMTV